MPAQKKIEQVAVLKDRIAGASALYFLDFTGVGVNDFNALRRELGNSGASVTVVKNRLALRALSESGVEADFGQMFRGPTSVVLAGADPVAPARVISGAQKRLEALKVKGAFVDTSVYGAEQFAFLASLPTKQDLRAQLVGVLQAPLYDFVMSLDGLLSEFAFVLEKIGEKKAEPEPAAS